MPDVPWEPVTTVSLALGSLDGQPIGEVRHDLPVPALFHSYQALSPFAHRVGGAGVVLGYFDGATSVVEWVDAGTGAGSVLLRSDRPIHNAVLSADRRTLYAVLLDPVDHTEAGVWSFDLGAGDIKGRRLLPPTGADPEHDGLVEELYLTPDGSTLVARDCFRECRIRVVDVATRAFKTLARKLPMGTQAHGLTDRALVFDANCELPCPLAALDLQTGRITGVGLSCTTGLVLDTAQGDIVLGDGDAAGCFGRGEIRIVAAALTGDPPAGAIREVFRSQIREAALIGLGDMFDAFLPDGTFLIATGGSPVSQQPPGLPLLVDVFRGTTTQLPPLRSR